MKSLLIGLINGYREIQAHKVRSLLSLLGVIIGVASLVTVFALVKGMSVGWSDWINLRGGIQKVTVLSEEVPPEESAIQGRSKGLSLEDANCFKACTLLSAISPELTLNGKLRYRDRELFLEILACQRDYFKIEEHVLAAGRFISDLDEKHLLPVIVLGSLTAEELFGNQNPLGEEVVFKEKTFQVVGVMQERYVSRHARRWMKFENQLCHIPLSTAMASFRNSTNLSRLNVKIIDTDNTAPAVGQLEQVLSLSHKGIHDYRFSTSDERVARFNEQQEKNKMVGALIGGMSLLVGGIGIMNIMLASISERLREIGIRKAVGASGFDIFIQILFETISLSTLGGLLGLLAGWGLSHLIGMMMPEQPPILSLEAMVIGFLFSGLTGIVFGVYPALRASKLSPIEALRA
jgi:ABC-type antimicrobial peptide transport system permease subunit